MHAHFINFTVQNNKFKNKLQLNNKEIVNDKKMA